MFSAGAVFFGSHRVRHLSCAGPLVPGSAVAVSPLGALECAADSQRCPFPRAAKSAVRRLAAAGSDRGISWPNILRSGVLCDFFRSRRRFRRTSSRVSRARIALLTPRGRRTVRPPGRLARTAESTRASLRLLVHFPDRDRLGGVPVAGASRSRESPPSAGWRRTVDGWERRAWWETEPTPFRPALHPAAVLLIACLASLGSGLACAPAAGRAALGAPHLRRDFFVRKHVRVRTIKRRATSVRRASTPSPLVAERLQRPHENRTCD